MENLQPLSSNISYFSRWEGESPDKYYRVYLIHTPTKCVIGIAENMRHAKEFIKLFGDPDYQFVDYAQDNIIGNPLTDGFYVNGDLNITRKNPYRFSFRGKAVQFHVGKTMMYCWAFMKGE